MKLIEFPNPTPQGKLLPSPQIITQPSITQKRKKKKNDDIDLGG